MELQGNYFYHEGSRFWPIGFNYWPSRTGVHCWKRFDLSEWEEDFDAIVARGFNTVRLFLLWEDFQPAEDRVDARQMQNLAAVCRAAADAGLWVVPTLFQGWMSGTNFDPPWRRGRNHVRDAEMRSAMVLLARAAAGALKEAHNILTIDYANEIDCICPDVDDASVARWTEELAEAIRAERPGTIVTNGTAVNPFRSVSKWSFGAQAIDFMCVHGYPVFWNPLAARSLGSCRATLKSGHISAFAGAYGPHMREEFGTAMGADGGLAGGFVRASVMASYLAGSNGFLYWCWRDFSTREFPYQDCPFEASLGYADTDLAAKEWSAGLDEARDWILAHGEFAPVPPDVAVYVPAFWKRSGPEAERAIASAYENLAANGVNPSMTARISSDFNLVVVPVAHLTVDEIVALDEFVAAGGRLIVLGLPWRTCGRYWEQLTGARNTDILSGTERIDLEWNGSALSIGPLDRYRMIPVLEPLDDSARIHLLHDAVPVVVSSDRGAGRVVQFVPPLHEVVCDDVHPAQVAFWRELISLSGYRNPISVSDPGCQAGIIEDGRGNRRILAINHGDETAEVKIEGLGKSWDMEIPSKGFVCCGGS